MASRNPNVHELWLFGSRAKGTSRPDSDIDIALAPMPPTEKHHWAIEAYFDNFDDWKAELKAMLNWEVSLELIGRDKKMDAEIKKSGVQLCAVTNWLLLPLAVVTRAAERSRCVLPYRCE